jgi:Endonuclease/Exonuclease/phosphatase family.
MINYPRPPGTRRQERQRNDENRLSGIYGDHIKPKKRNTIRILFQNPQGLGRMDSNDNIYTDKINSLKNVMLKHTIDVIGFAEVNKDWRNIPQTQTFWQVTEGWFEYRRLATSINQTVTSNSPTQFGGTLLMTTNQLAHRTIQLDQDPRRLGRWTSVLLQGKQERRCRIVCAYCPCIGTGTNTVYVLQTAGLAQQNIHICPRKAFWDDLKEYITQKQENGEFIILLGDWNSDYKDVSEWMDRLGFKDAIYSRHNVHPPPITCKRSNECPLDAIFIPQHLHCNRGGFFAFDYLKGDHRGLWCDIPEEYLLGFNLNKLPNPQARRLKMIDPRTRKAYISRLHKILLKLDIYQHYEDLFNEIKRDNIADLPKRFEQLDNQITLAMEQAERGCRKLKKGQIKWSPKYQNACDTVTYWKLVLSEAQGNIINVRKLRSLRRKLGLDRFQGQENQAKQELSKAREDQKKYKRQAENLQLEYRSSLAMAKEAEDKIKAAIHIRNLTTQEATR